MKRQEIEKIINIYQRSEKLKKEIMIDKIMQELIKTHMTLEEAERVGALLNLS